MEITNQKIKYFLYARKSSESEDRQIQSIDDQVDRLKKLAADLNLSIKKIYTEAKSAKKPNNRSIFDEMIQQIESGEADGILCWHLNRLTRNPIDSGKLGWLLQQGIIKSIQTIERQYLPDDNVLLFSVETGQANQYILDLSRDTKRGLLKKLNAGWQNGIARLGYINDKENKIIIKDPERFNLVRKMWDLMLTGNYTPPKILDIANREWGFKTRKFKRMGGNPLSRSGIYNIFTSLFYAGVIESKGVQYDGKHERMITLEEYDRVQMLLGRKGKPRPKSRIFAFTGLMRCGECGCLITAEAKNQIICSECKLKFSYENKTKCPKCGTLIEKMKNPTILNYIYYHCTKKRNKNCTQGGVEVKELEKQIDEYLASIQINQKYLDWAINHLRRTHKLEVVTRDEIIKSQQGTYNDMVNKLDKLLELRLKEEITEEEFKEKKTSLIKEKERIQELLKDSDHRQNQWLELSEKTFNFARYARFWFAEGDLQRKRDILSTLGQNLILDGKKLRIQLQEPFSIIQKGLQPVLQKQERLEPAKDAKNGFKNEKSTQNLDGFHALLRR
ncbi:MAG: hypothetical protein A2V69_02445 [Candidatus Portnoybacteria bacterium RBG_13_40_8]|uniref:Recombinase domain-containing protein n=1 Tax=Candidatus Portnoybacteria bacterium RBG_13_40_8 TaxID=1801990 RepID=A0A1G2F328_9BACT|nr:MAG: hypothetical protein A2V69_02445 [Candidatus Portnoybacteria bacterium RBG_13_40_8]OGZ34595.1 MAG: hypothetical protein A2V60_02340 [Candidatus Portnoybacteria bacterium RIFCSPHIGHO2_01_FULL_39_19]